MAEHAQVGLSANGQSAEIDAGIADLIEQIWNLGCETRLSCQERPDGKAFITFPDRRDAERFLSVAARAFDAHPESLYNRICQRWCAIRPEDDVDDETRIAAAESFAAARFWSYHAATWDDKARLDSRGNPVIEDPSGRSSIKLEITVAFPASDIAELVTRCREANGLADDYAAGRPS